MRLSLAPVGPAPNTSGVPDAEIKARIAHFVGVLGLNAVARELSTERLTLANYVSGAPRRGSITFIECVFPHALANIERLMNAKAETSATETKKPMRMRRSKKAAP